MEGLRSTSERPGSEIFDHLSAIGDPLRCRILLLLESHELTVSEICSVLQLPQSTVSRHLKHLMDHDWIRARRDGTRRRYSISQATLEPALERLWSLVRDEVASGSAAAQDRSRLDSVLARRRTRSQEFFSTTAGEWAEVRRQMFGQRFELEGLLGLVDHTWTVGDLGCGTGQTSASLARFVDRVIAVDDSRAMLAAARQRLSDLANVGLRQGRLEHLPIDSHSLDAALAVLVLHHLAEPATALSEAARTLKEGGKLLIVDMLAHEREEYRQTMGHVWLGFEPDRVRQWLEQAGFEDIRTFQLSAEPDAKGPTLFGATAIAAGRSRANPSRRRS